MKLVSQGHSCLGFYAVPGLPRRIFLSRAATFTAVKPAAAMDSHSLQVGSWQSRLPVNVVNYDRQGMSERKLFFLQKKTQIKRRTAQAPGRLTMLSCRTSLQMKGRWLCTRRTGCQASIGEYVSPISPGVLAFYKHAASAHMYWDVPSGLWTVPIGCDLCAGSKTGGDDPCPSATVR